MDVNKILDAFVKLITLEVPDKNTLPTVSKRSVFFMALTLSTALDKSIFVTYPNVERPFTVLTKLAVLTY